VKHQFKVFLWALWSILILAQEIQGQLLSREMGTIIVTYQTDQAGQRLDRVHFWLINDQHERTLYPKKDEFVSNNHTPNERTVVITHLPAGHYHIEFLLPNTDQLFEEIPSRDVNLKPGEVIKIDQTIRLRPISSLASPKANELAFVVINQENPFFPFSSTYPPPTPFPAMPFGSSTNPANFANFSLVTDQDTSWKLILHGQLIYTRYSSI
jgi:hypothetical protein